MKITLLFTSILTTITLSALVNPLSPAIEYAPLFNCHEDVSLKMGYRGDFVFNRKMHSSQGEIERLACFANEGALGFNFARQSDLYLFMGSNHMSYASFFGTDQLKMDFKGSFIAGFAATAILYEWCCLDVGEGSLSLTGQYEDTSWTKPHTATINGTLVDAGTYFRYREGSVSLSVGQKIKNLVPYIALNWSMARVRVRNNLTVGNLVVGPMLKNSRTFGLGFGLSLVDAARMLVTVEARLINEDALTINADFHF